MNWDAGSLSKYRYNSPIYRYLSNSPPRSSVWPKGYKDEVAILIATPGVSWRWVQHNFNFSAQRMYNLFKHSRQFTEQARENMLSATHDDALMYMKYSPRSANIPIWVFPFIADDLKKGLGWRPTARKWGVSTNTIDRLKKGDIGNVLHFSRKPRWGSNLAR